MFSRRTNRSVVSRNSVRLNRDRRSGIEGLEDRALMAADAMIGAVAAMPAAPIAADVLPGDLLKDKLEIPKIELPGDLIPVPGPHTGMWTNPDSNATGLTKLEITRTLAGYKVEAWGACTPDDCDWGKTGLDMLGTSVSDSTPDYAMGSWDHGFKDSTITIDLETPAGKVVDVYNVFKDDSGRENYHQRYLLTNSGSLLNINDFGNNELADVLVGGWVNSDVNSGGVAKLVISGNSETGQVHGYGSCTPTDCDWGTVPLNGVGSTVADATPEYAIANYEFGFESKFVTTRFDGSNLVVGTYTVFHDDSGRYNYFSDDVMWKLGDANHDGHFSTADLVQVMQAGEYEDGVDGNSTWEEGDFNRDGDFDSADIIAAFQSGGYEAERILDIGKIKVPELIPLPKFDPTIRFDLAGGAIDDLFQADDLSELLPVWP